jgi:hypothetical protein
LPVCVVLRNIRAQMFKSSRQDCNAATQYNIWEGLKTYKNAQAPISLWKCVCVFVQGCGGLACASQSSGMREETKERDKRGRVGGRLAYRSGWWQLFPCERQERSESGQAQESHSILGCVGGSYGSMGHGS